MVPERVAIAGARGQLGRELVRAFSAAGCEVLALARPSFDLTRKADLGRVTAWRPEMVVNAAAWTDVDGCARDPDRAANINGVCAGALAAAAAAADALSVQISTNEIFDGTLWRPYAEDDDPAPINAYGHSKLLGECLVAEMNSRHLIIRTAWLFGGEGSSFVTRITAAAQRAKTAGEPLGVVSDEWGNPTPAPVLAQRIVQTTRVRETPTYLHLAGTPPVSRYDWARSVLGGQPVAVQPISSLEYHRPSQPPLRAILDTARSEALGLAPLAWREFEPVPLVFGEVGS